MAVYQDLLDAIARVRAGTGDGDAWMRGLSGADLAVAANLVAVRTPGAIDAVLAKIRAGHPEVFGLPAAAPDIPPGSADPQSGGQGTAADAIRVAETALAQQKSATAQLDLQVITAVLNAHVSDVTGGAALDGLQRDIEAAVAARTDLDTPAGARGFQRYLVGKLRDIRTVVETAGLDATSKAALAAALASLYAAAPTDATGSPAAEQPTPEPRDAAAPAAPADVTTAPGDDALLDELLGPDPGPDAGPAPVGGAPAPVIPALPALPTFGGGGSGLGAPLGGGWPPTAAGGAPPPIGPDLAPVEDAGGGAPDDLAAALRDDSAPDPDEPADDPGDDPGDDDGAAAAEETDNTVRLPGGETVTAGSPELAAAITAAVAGTPIAEAFAQQGITIPAPGTPVTDPVDADRLVAGDVGILTDRHALVLGNGTALVDERIQPVGSVTGPDFLGWEHPPVPGPTAPTKSDAPTPTRPAVTAGPS